MARKTNNMSDRYLYGVYFAPRGIVRMTQMGMTIAQRHLSAFDRLIGIVGEAGSGKSMLVKGMFPGLETTNDDNGVNVRPLPLLSWDETDGFYSPHTYHIDVRFELAFTQMHMLVEAIQGAISKDRRVVVEHFDLIAPMLNLKADLIIGIGEEMIVTRPTIFGPEPQDVADIVFKSVKYRKMAHTAEDLAERALTSQGIETTQYQHGDIRHGFLLEFDKKPDVNLHDVEAYVRRRIEQDMPVSFFNENHIKFGEKLHLCTGPRMHVRSTGEIEGFMLLDELMYDEMSGKYLIVGLVGGADVRDLHDMNRI